MNKLIFMALGFILILPLGCKGSNENQAPSGSGDSAPESAVVMTEMSDNPSASPTMLNKEDFLKQVMNYEKNVEEWVFEGEIPCIVDFYADWCAPCRITGPILEELAEEYAGRINIYKVDVDAEQELAAVFGIQSIPSLLFCPMEGKPTLSSGIKQTPEETKELFIQIIEEVLFNSKVSAL